jgi:hypothetical protein
VSCFDVAGDAFRIFFNGGTIGKKSALNLGAVCAPPGRNGDPSLPAPLGWGRGVIGWVVVAERPPKNQGRIEAARTLAARP